MLNLYSISFYVDDNKYRVAGCCFDSYEAMKAYAIDLVNNGFVIKAVYNYIGKKIVVDM